MTNRPVLAVPGSWSSWGQWTSCNVECGRGLQVNTHNWSCKANFKSNCTTFLNLLNSFFISLAPLLTFPCLPFSPNTWLPPWLPYYSPPWTLITQLLDSPLKTSFDPLLSAGAAANVRLAGPCEPGSWVLWSGHTEEVLLQPVSRGTRGMGELAGMGHTKIHRV